jgi:hypothetical protein
MTAQEAVADPMAALKRNIVQQMTRQSTDEICIENETKAFKDL